MNSYLETIFSLQGKVALVTGGGRGIGEMIARALLGAGAKTYIVSRNEQACRETAQNLEQYGECIPFGSDLSTAEGIESLRDFLVSQERSLDILVNNSGKTWGAPFAEFPEHAWDSVMGLNVKTPFLLMQALLPLLVEGASVTNPAQVINIGSVAGIMNGDLSAYSYSASKAAINHLTRVLAKDLASQHILVNAIAPGFFPTKMTAGVFADEQVTENFLSGIPLGRLGEPDDIGALAIMLAANRYITGNVIPIDGGFLVSQ